MNVYRVCPTLDLSVDVKAKDEDEAIRKVQKATEEIIRDCCNRLMNELNHLELGCDPTYITDSWPFEETDPEYEGQFYETPLLPEPKEAERVKANFH